MNPQLFSDKAGNGFAEFWAAYPKKVARTGASKAWAKLKPSDVSAVMAGLAAQNTSEQWTKDGGRFIPNAATWLNGRRWEDELNPGDEIDRLREELRAHPGNPNGASFHADVTSAADRAGFETKRARYLALAKGNR